MLLFFFPFPETMFWACTQAFLEGNCFLHHITASDFSGKDETVLKFFFRNMCYGFFFLKRNFILRIFLSGFSFLFPDFHFRNIIISFLKFFFEMYYFSILDFFVRNRILIFVSEFLFPKLNNHFQIYFSKIYYFQF